MTNFKALLTVFTTLISILFGSLNAQEQPEDKTYLWPTDASKSLTSSFGEYRARRYHAGFDVRTRGKTGFKCFAVRSGYIWRVSVSPSGYGKAIYLKLDTGEIAVYAHLSKFMDELEKYVKAEQKRRGKYRINLFLKPTNLPVKQGQVIGYTGQTGIGAPHLHFEIRDASNRPTNPLLKGYELPDRVNPIVRKVSFTPLNAQSEANGDYRPVVIMPQWVKAGQYYMPEPVTIWGNVGVAVSSYDKSSGSSSRFGVYSLTLFVDDVQRFHYSYDRIAFQDNPMVELERDYRLSRRNQGRFYKLYKDRHNVLQHYSPNKTWAGVLTSASLNAIPSIAERSRATDEKAYFNTGTLLPGLHDLRIEVSDFFNNVSTISGKLNVGGTFDIRPIIQTDSSGALTLTDIMTYDINRVEELGTFVFRNRRWEQLPFDWTTSTSLAEEKGGESVADDAFETASNILMPAQTNPSPLILRFEGRDQFGVASYPYYYIQADTAESSVAPEVDVNYDFYNDYVRIEITSNNILKSTPVVTLYPERRDARPVALHQTALKTYVGRLELSRLTGTEHPLRLTFENLNQEQFSVMEQFSAEAIAPKVSSRIFSADQKFWVNFWSNSLYNPIYTRIAIDSVTTLKDYDLTGNIYEVEPSDVLLKKGAFVHLQYPDSTTNPDKLGIYYKTRRGKWVFIDNKRDVGNNSISAKVLSFEKFVLIRDDVAPEITRIRPANQTRLRDAMPLLSMKIVDRLSGISNENEIEMRLDGKKLIAEYDPERYTLTYQVENPLKKGQHELTVMVADKSGNVSIKKSTFGIE